MIDPSRRNLLDDESLDRGMGIAFGPAANAKTVAGSPATPAIASSAVAATSPTRPIDAPGGRDRIGRFEVAGEIARGGVGSILKARDIEIGRDVALKVLLDDHAGNAEMASRFIEEARITGRLQHPGIVPVYEMGRTPSNRPFFAMELVDGSTLADLLARRSDAAEDRQRFLGIFLQVCQTLAYAHTRRVIHRDLKPSNIMVGPFGEVQVMDWGLAKMIGRAEPPTVDDALALPARSPSPPGRSPSVAGSVLGTPAYMAPEQARGEVTSLDERADVFGLGAILCEILTGRPPYEGRTIHETCSRARNGDLTDAHVRLEGCGADREPTALARECLAREPGDRPRDAGEVAARARGYLESLEARARTMEVRAARARARLVLAVTVLAALIVGAGGYLWLQKVKRDGEARTADSVGRAVREIGELRTLARTGGPEALSRWDAAEREAKMAAELASGLPPSALRGDVERLRDEVFREAADRRLAARLERIREDRGHAFERIGRASGEEGPSEREDVERAIDEAGEEFEAAFREYDLDLRSLDPAKAAERIRASRIATDLVLALDLWAALGKVAPGFDPEFREKLIGIAGLADGDPWRKTLRSAESARDLETLQGLADDPDIRKAAPSTLEYLALTFRDLREPYREETVLAMGVRLHPEDFWMQARLGRLLIGARRPLEALRPLSAAAALRPASGYAHHLLGLAWQGVKDLPEAAEELRTDISLDPGASRSYYVLSSILEAEPAALRAAELAAILSVLEASIAPGKTFHHDGLIRLLAQVLFLRGDRVGAVLALEESFRVPWAQHGGAPFRGPSHAGLLDRYRAALAPDLPSFASIDAALDADPGDAPPDPVPAIREALATSAGPIPGAARLAYFEGRFLARDGKRGEAAGRFAEVLTAEPRFPEPYVRRAESLRAAGDPAGAEKDLRAVLGRRGLRYAELWNLWLAISFVDLKRSPPEALATLPGIASGFVAPARAPIRIPSRYGEDVRWLLERLARVETVRINCGGDDNVGTNGASWGRDRFFTVGGSRFRFGAVRVATPIEGTEDDAIYQTERWFSPHRGGSAGYRIPLPPGEYRVTLHFAEIYWPARDRASGFRRSFDVRIEGKTVLEDYSPLEKGFAVADARPFTIAVSDGILDIEFVHRVENPKVSGIEIIRLTK
jgi:eukaryotic-like serine/threonine-protein kinase